MHPLGSDPLPAPPAPRVGRTAALRVVDAAVSTEGRSCSCGHGKQAHEHYRRGTDCALCACGRYRRPLLRLFAR